MHFFLYEPYFFLLVTVAVFALVGLMKRSDGLENNLFSFYILVLTSVLTAVKAVGVGADDQTYQSYFEDRELLSEFAEPLFALIVLVFQKFGLGVTAFAIFTNTIFVIGAISFCRYFGIPFAFWVLCYMAFGNFFEITYDHIRNGLSLGITLFFLPYLFRREYLIYIFGVLISTLVHFSAIIFLPLPFIVSCKLGWKTAIMVLFASIVVTKIEFYSFISDLMQGAYGLGLDALFIRFASKDLESEYASGFRWSAFGVVKYLIGFFVLIANRRGVWSDALKVYVYGIVLWAFFHEISIFSGRFWRSISVIEPIMIFYCLSMFKRKEIGYILIVFLLILAGIFFIPARSQPFEFSVI